MKIVQNRFADFILVRNRKSLPVFPFVFVRRDVRITEHLENHLRIHLRQQREMLVLFHLLWYGLEWLLRAARHRPTASERVAFEQEAHLNGRNENYCFERRPFSWTKYLNC